MNIVEFLRARLDEDEAVAREARFREHLNTRDASALTWHMEDGLSHMRATSGRVLREVEAKRRMLDDIVDNDYFPAAMVTDGLSARWLYWTAAVYADHPDYDPAWKV